MKQSLTASLGQNLAMTPALQQAIKLLQLSTLDLTHEVQQALDSNLMLERVDENTDPADTDQAPQGKPGDIPDELPVDADWTDIYGNGPTSRNYVSEGISEFRQASMQARPSLTRHLMDQVALEHFDTSEQAVAEYIVDALNEDGYLAAPWEEFSRQVTELTAVPPEGVESVLARIRQLDPPGVAACSLSECLEIQLQQLPEDTPGLQQALQIIPQHLDLLARPDSRALRKVVDLDDATENTVRALIRTLQPRPGAPFHDHEANYIKPEVYVEKKKGRWVVKLNHDITPRLRINPYYHSLVRRGDKSADQTCIKNHLQEARFFIKSLHSRNETLLQVSQVIVEQQQAFLEHGEQAMKPMVLRDVAEKIGIHESTVSRATAHKYMQCPRGVFELKYFFSGAVSSTGSGEQSAVAIQAMIKQLVDEEPTGKPYSDNKIVQLLLEKDVHVARRTVAKYRELQHIPPSSERRYRRTSHKT